MAGVSFSSSLLMILLNFKLIGVIDILAFEDPESTVKVDAGNPTEISQISCLCDNSTTNCNCPFSEVKLNATCEPNPCLNNGSCTGNSTVGFYCLCPPPYVGARCQCSSHLCLESNICGEELKCVSYCQSVGCHCIKEGFTADIINKKCVDINECSVLDVCLGDYELCNNFPGNYSCDCLNGYERKVNETKCEDIDECLRDVCAPNSICTNTLGSFHCSCLPGYSGTQCQDVDECEQHLDDCQQVCENTVGNYDCSCFEDFRLENDTCNYIGNESCSIECGSGTCVNGSCMCNRGYQADNSSGFCIDINECFDNPCGRNAECINIVGSYSCFCESGHTTDQQDICIEVNECENSTFCGPFSVCNNTRGNATCSCLPGYELQNGQCTEIDDCQFEPNELCMQRNSICVDLVNGYECRCRPGFYMENNLCSLAKTSLLGHLTIKRHFSNNLLIPKTLEFRALASEIEELLVVVVPDITSQVQVLGFGPGSTVVSYVVELKVNLSAETFNDYLFAMCQPIMRTGISSKSCLLSAKIAIENRTTLQYSADYFDACNSNVVEEYCPSLTTDCIRLERGRYECQCKSGLRMLTKFNNIPICADIDECKKSDTVCNKNQICKNEFRSYKCICAGGFYPSGDECHDLCHPDSCKNGGKCFVVERNAFACECGNHYLGKFCEFPNKPLQEAQQLLYIVSGVLGATLFFTLVISFICCKRLEKKRHLETIRIMELTDKCYHNPTFD